MSTDRKRGMRGGGTIFQRPDGRWQGQVSLGHSGGKRKRVSVTGKTVAEVQRKMRDMKSSADKGVPVLSITPRLSEYLAVWLERKKTDNTPKTYKFYESIVRLHIVPDLGHIRIHKLTQHDVNALLSRKIELANKSTMQKENPKSLASGEPRIRFSVASVDAIRRVLRAALNDAERDDYVGRNVASLSKPPTVPRFEGKALSVAEAHALLQAVSGTRYSVLYQMALGLGMRQGEILGLRWEDVDFDAGVVNVRLQLQRVDGLQQLVPLKTVESRRTLPLPDSKLQALKRHRIEQMEQRLQAGGKWQGEGWQLVFMTPNGTPIDDANLRKDFRKRLDQAGIEHMRFHDLRHSTASFLAAEGVHITESQHTLGHAQPITTMQVYTHAQIEKMRAGLERLDALLEAPKEAKSDAS